MIRRYVPRFITVLLVFLAITVTRPLSGGFIPSVDQIPDEPDIISADPSVPVDTPVILPEPAEPPDPDITDEEDRYFSISIDAPDDPLSLPPFIPRAAYNVRPDIMLESTAIMADREIVDSFSFDQQIDFGFGSTYSQIDGITAFRDSNFRDNASFGFADISEGRFGKKWTRGTGILIAPDEAVWTGLGWTGQPLIVKWPKQTRAIMNMHDWAKEKDELVEVVYAAMDGYIYFSELETGKDTRERLFIGFTFKGSGSLDPRGYPLLYVGAGYNSELGTSRIFIISLVDGSVLYTFGQSDSFALRSWPMADASPLIDAENDRLIYPSENGILYIIDLNSEFDPQEGTITIAPSSPVKWRYNGKRSNVNSQYWLGFEASPAILRGHIFLADNGGHLICLDLNTLKPAWVFDTLDDTNNTPVITIEDGHPYVYIGAGFHAGWRGSENSIAVTPVWKIDAVTGAVVWQTDYMSFTVTGVSGGVQGSIASGRHGLRNLIFVPVARTPSIGRGILAALDKQTGEIVWEFETSSYTWSSPVCVYDKEGKGYIIYCTANGYMHLIDGHTGDLLDEIYLGGTIEASPAVYENTIVVGTRSTTIWGVTLE